RSAVVHLAPGIGASNAIPLPLQVPCFSMRHEHFGYLGRMLITTSYNAAVRRAVMRVVRAELACCPLAPVSTHVGDSEGASVSWITTDFATILSRLENETTARTSPAYLRCWQLLAPGEGSAVGASCRVFPFLFGGKSFAAPATEAFCVHKSD